MKAYGPVVRLPRRNNAEGGIGFRDVLPAGGGKVVVVDSDNLVTHVCLTEGLHRQGVTLPPDSPSQPLASAMDPSGTFLAQATAGAVEIRRLFDGRRVDRLSIDGVVHSLEFVATARDLRIRFTVGEDDPDGDRPVGSSVQYPAQPGPRELTWERDSGLLGRKSLSTQTVTPGGVRIEVGSAPRLEPADPAAWMSALCQLLAPDDLRADLIAELPAEARDTPACR